MRNQKNLKKLYILPGILLVTGLGLATGLLSSCQSLQSSKEDLQEWWNEETGAYSRHHEKDTNLLSSSNPKDYMLPNGKGIAIPGAKAWDLYISPFAPSRYFRCRSSEGTEVIDPYSGRKLILGSRKEIADKEIPD